MDFARIRPDTIRPFCNYQLDVQNCGYHLDYIENVVLNAGAQIENFTLDIRYCSSEGKPAGDIFNVIEVAGW